MKKYLNFYLKIFNLFFGGKMFSIFEKACFRNAKIWLSDHKDPEAIHHTVVKQRGRLLAVPDAIYSEDK